MSLTRFSSEPAGDSPDRPTAARPRAGAALVPVEPIAVAANADGHPGDVLEFPMGAGLDTFSPERSETIKERSEPIRPPRPVEPLPTAKRSSVSGTATAFVPAPLPDITAERHSTPASAPLPVHTARTTSVPAAVSPPAAKTARKDPKRSKRPHRWRRQVSPQAVVVALIVGAVLEAGWLGMRVAGGLSRTPARPAAVASVPLPQAASAAARATEIPPAQQVPPGPSTRVEQSAPATIPLKPPANPKAPVWVTISTPVPVEVLEGGRRLGTSWGGGLRLSPGTHNLHIVNRATGLDVHQAVDIVSGTANSLVFEFDGGVLRRIQTRRVE
jgi:hypothetical protein